MTTAVHTFTELGFRTMPIGQTGVKLTRDSAGKKQLLDAKGKVLTFKDVMPANWTKLYGQASTAHKNTPLGGLICGQLTDKQPNEIEVIALDCDNAAAWDLFTKLDPKYTFRFKSIGKAGGTILYQLPEELYDLRYYGVKNSIIEFDFITRRESGINAMIYLPTKANTTKANIAKGAELNLPPPQIISLLRLLKPQLAIVETVSDSTNTNLPFNAPLVKQFVLDVKGTVEGSPFIKLDVTPLIEKVYSVFTPRKFRNAPHYCDVKWLHPNSAEILELGAWSEYIVGVSAIAGADPSIDAELYADFMQAVNAQVDDPMPPKRFLDEVVSPMILQKSKIKGQPIWKYNEKWDQTSHTIVNQYGETLEYYTLENAANKFIEFNHATKELVEIPGTRALRDQVYSKDTDPQQECPAANIVKKLKLIRVESSIKLPIGIFTDDKGRAVLNTAEPCFPLRVLQNSELLPDTIEESNLYVQAFNTFMSHLLNHDEDAMLFMRQCISFHGKHLDNIPVIMYMVGVGGAGKSHFAYFMELFFGANATSRPSAAQVTGRFNDFLVDTAVLILSETGDAALREQEGIKAILKTVTGEKTIDVESKGKPIRTNAPVFALPILLANEPWYREDSADRRLFSIMPKTTMEESTLIADFERAHGVRIIDLIVEGIKKGVVSKYLAGFCPRVLPAVPLTTDKQMLSIEQKDPIMVVKNVVATHNWYTLFDLMEEHCAELFFTAMESPMLRDKDTLYKNQLVELVKNMRGTDLFVVTDKVISMSFTPRWLPNQAAQYRPRKDNALALRLGYLKWKLPIEAPYNEWKLLKLSDEDA